MVVQEKDSIAEFFLENGFSSDNPNFHLYPKHVFGLKMLFADHVDMIPSHPLTLKYEMANQGLDESKVEKVMDLSVEGAYYMAYSKGTDDRLIESTQKAFDKLKKERVIESIRARFSVD